MTSFYEDMAGVGLASGRSCATVPAVTIDPNSERQAHKMPGRMATATIIECVSTADLMQEAILTGKPQAEIENLREIAKAQFEAYLDMMAQAATHVRALKP